MSHVSIRQVSDSVKDDDFKKIDKNHVSELGFVLNKNPYITIISWYKLFWDTKRGRSH